MIYRYHWACGGSHRCQLLTHPERQAKRVPLWVCFPPAQALNITGISNRVSLWIKGSLGAHGPSHLSVQACCHGHDVPCFTVDGEHVLGRALGCLGDNPVPHHAVGCGAVICIVGCDSHHVCTWNRQQVRWGWSDPQTPAPVTHPGLSMTQWPVPAASFCTVWSRSCPLSEVALQLAPEGSLTLF